MSYYFGLGFEVVSWAFGVGLGPFLEPFRVFLGGGTLLTESQPFTVFSVFLSGSSESDSSFSICCSSSFSSSSFF
jgi:hypothetical protein